MQEYLRRPRLGEILDGLGSHLLILALCLGWFIFLWGLRLPALTAGGALYFLALMIRHKSRDGRLKRREKKLRERLGGEMTLERLLLADPDKAHFEVALLLSQRYPLALLRAGEEGMLCQLGQEKLLVAFDQRPENGAVSAERVLALQRQVRAEGADRGVLCVNCKVSQEAQEQAAKSVRVSFFSRDALIVLAGAANPATDRQLVELGRRRRRPSLAWWARLILDRRRARRYAFYGALLLAMYLITRYFYYAVPGLVCLALAAASRCVKERQDSIEE